MGSWKTSGGSDVFDGGTMTERSESALLSQLDGETTNSVYFHLHLGNIPILTNVFQMG